MKVQNQRIFKLQGWTKQFFLQRVNPKSLILQWGKLVLTQETIKKGLEINEFDPNIMYDRTFDLLSFSLLSTPHCVY